MCLQDVKEENGLILFRRQDMDSKQVYSKTPRTDVSSAILKQPTQ